MSFLLKFVNIISAHLVLRVFNVITVWATGACYGVFIPIEGVIVIIVGIDGCSIFVFFSVV